MKYLPFLELAGTPNIVVDGSAGADTLLVLSHWPQSGTPALLKADTSAQSAFLYLEKREFHCAARAVSNNHFDQDGIAGVWTLLNPEEALARRALVEDVAAAGDFGTYRDRRAARIAMALGALCFPETSPLDASLYVEDYDRRAANLYQALLPRFGELLDHPEDFRDLWVHEDAVLEESEDAVRDGRVRIEEHPALDLAVVHLPQDMEVREVHRFTKQMRAACHPMAILSATDCFRLLLVRGRSYEFRYRYESWVQYMTRRPLPRVDLAPLVERLAKEETGGGVWEAQGFDAINPALTLEGAGESSLGFERFFELLAGALAAGAPAWSPYDEHAPAHLRV
ncbi:MAG TPA: DUF6687 family protein [Planctomycetota bacterium]